MIRSLMHKDFSVGDTSQGTKYTFTMSSNSVQATGTAGLVAGVSASTIINGSYPAWRAFNANPTNPDYWYSSTGSSQWLRVNFNAGQVVRRYDITSGHDPGYTPKVFEFQGSNDGSSWTTLDTRSGGSTPSAYEVRSYTYSNATSYLHYRILVTETFAAANADYVVIAEMELYN